MFLYSWRRLLILRGSRLDRGAVYGMTSRSGSLRVCVATHGQRSALEHDMVMGVREDDGQRGVEEGSKNEIDVSGSQVDTD